MAEEKRIYADYNATTPIREEVKSVMEESISVFGNASSLHGSGRKARADIEDARKKVSALIACSPGEIIFTSGGSESNNTVFKTMQSLAATDGGRDEFITSAIEHPCVLNSAKFTADFGLKVHFIPVDEYGKLNMQKFNSALSKKTLLVSIMTANNETGTIQNIAEISSLAKSKGAFVHTDAVQAAGKIPVDVNNLGIDYLTLSCHKIYGPKGVGALYIRKGSPLNPLILGGHQENGMRAGTYNNYGITAFGAAAFFAARDIDEYRKKIFPLKERLKESLLKKIPAIRINGHQEDTLPNTLNVSFPGAEGEAILLSMDIAGIEASTGSACASGSLEPSHVLMAMGLGPELAHGSIRFSLGWGTKEEDIDYITAAMPPIIERLRRMSTFDVRKFSADQKK